MSWISFEQVGGSTIDAPKAVVAATAATAAAAAFQRLWIILTSIYDIYF